MTRVSIVGTVGLPANYGGFETLAENLVRELGGDDLEMAVYCSAKTYPDSPDRPEYYEGAALRYVPLEANGAQSIFYDALSLFDACRKGDDVVLILGVSGGLFIPIAKALWNVKIVTNIDGLEWRRAKWGRAARAFLKLSERIAVRFSDRVVCDNQAISDYVSETYGSDSEMIAYGGDQALEAEPGDISDLELPDSYALGLCRIEPENNVDLILQGFSDFNIKNLVFVGNWGASDYGKALRQKYDSCGNIKMVDPIYDTGRLRAIRDRAKLYVHGHSAGGTNPSLVEMMHFGIPVLAYDCVFNRHSTEDSATYFRSAKELGEKVEIGDLCDGAAMKSIADRRYCWSQIAAEYGSLLTPLTRTAGRFGRWAKSVTAMAVMGLFALMLSGCGVIYISPSVQTDDEDFPVEVVPLSFSSVARANTSVYEPVSIPRAFYQHIPAQQLASEVTEIPFPQAPGDGRTPPTANLPPKGKSEPYRIGVGDVLSLLSDGEQGLDPATERAALKKLGYRVGNDGSIVIPSIGSVQIAGLTLSESHQLIFDRLLTQGRDPGISLDVQEFNSQFVTIGGAVGRPGRVPIKMSPLTLNEAIAEAAGKRLREERTASILIARGSELYEIPVGVYKSNPELQQTLLQSGDAIFVEENYDVDRALAFFERQVQIASVQNEERNGASARLSQRLSHRRNALDEQRRAFDMRKTLDAIDRDYVYLAGELEAQARFTLPFQRQATLADALFSKGGFNVPFSNPGEIYVLRVVQPKDGPQRVRAYHLNSRNAARLALATQLEMRPNDVVFIEEQPIAKWERSLRSVFGFNPPSYSYTAN